MSSKRLPSPSSPAAPAPAELPPKVVVRPAGDPERERQQRFRRLMAEHGPWILSKLIRPGVTPASAEDLRQEVVLVLSDFIDEHGYEPTNVRGFLVGVMLKKLSNRSRRGRLDLDAGAELEEQVTSSADPEQKVQGVQRWRRLERHVDGLSRVEAAAFQRVEVEGDTYEQAAEALGCAVGTVVTRVARARAKLESAIQDSDRAAEVRLAALDQRREEK